MTKQVTPNNERATFRYEREMHIKEAVMPEDIQINYVCERCGNHGTRTFPPEVIEARDHHLVIIDALAKYPRNWKVVNDELRCNVCVW